MNADEGNLVNFGESNLFSYCYNSPITQCDYSGKIPQAFVAVAAVASSLFVTTFALSILMYTYAATGSRTWNNIDISSWWNPIGKMMKSRLEKSKLIKNRIESYIKKISWDSYSQKEHINFGDRRGNLQDMDLFLSVGNASNCKTTVRKTKQRKWFSAKYKYTVTIELSDYYDFAKFDVAKRGKILTCINNGLGYYPMNWGILKPYWWKIKHTFDYYY